MIQFLKNSFAGREKLYKVWWLWGLPMFIFFFAGNRLIVHRCPWKPELTILVFFFATIVLRVFWWICAWRCAPNVENRVWMYAAWIFIGLQILRTAGTLWMMSLTWIL